MPQDGDRDPWGDDVSRDELLRRDLDELPVAARASLDEHHLLEGRHRLRRLALLVEPEDSVEEREEEHDDPGSVLVQRPDAADADDEQDDLHGVAVLADEGAPARLGLGLGELVRAVLRLPRRDLGGRQAVLDVDLQLPGDVLAGKRVPAGRGRRSCGRRHRFSSQR